jgi:murein DD-endopeptidase MepM/ murein hydrolase activator NlpD
MEALYGCTVADISLVNGIRSLDTLVPGQKLVIPVGGDLSAAREEARLRQAVLETKRNFPPRVAFSVYEVQPGDSAWSIAGKFDLDVNTVLGCNPKTLSGRIHPGIEVRIPNQDGILVKVSRGNTLASIARRYEVVESALASANGIAEPVLEAGTLLFVPGGKLIEDEDSAQGSVRKKSAKPASKESRFHWPLAGRVNSSYGWRRDPFTGGRDFHTGIDIGAPVGSPVRSATAGRVAFAGWMGGYGKSVVVEKGGLMIIYAHCSKLKVRPGQSVKKGQTVALVGSTGRSTGPHLHFEIRLNGRAVNPSRYYR